ncbi:LysR family transcriptional regulator [Aliagarivorans taiwanensis]|uniref:LysR family transcriptional regulator n=1 Tax=Aliagarivorans taiwanensis TaxID=561966 RepID=UPI00041E4E59|nr:LysR family transcriptional regulator [Aliagarivorans taiwanensis]
MVSLEQLRTYCMLVETGHFTRTAERLAMTQPGVSQHIRKLEQHYATALLIREGKRFSLSEAGERVYQQARKTLDELGALEFQLSHDDPHSGKLRLASPGSLGLTLYPELLELQQRHPGLNVHYHFAPNHSIETMLGKRELDVGLMSREPQDASLQAEQIATEALSLVVPASFSGSAWQELLALGFIDHPDGQLYASRLLAANYQEFSEFEQLTVSGFVNNISSILEPVSCGLGFTVVPQFAVDAFANQQALRVIMLKQALAEPILWVTRRHHPLASRFATLKELLIAHFNASQQ